MKSLKYYKKYPHLFATEVRTKNPVQVQLITRKDVEDYNEIKTTTDGLNKILDHIRADSWYSKCYGHRDSCDYFRVEGVQELLDYAHTASMRIKLLKKLAVEGGLAEYDSEGNFKILGED
jgi:hypothetical protein